MKIKELFTDESKWTQGSYAKDINKKSTLFDDKRAVCWCLEGAIYHCYDDGYKKKTDSIKERIRNKIGIHLPFWNDSPERTFEDIKNLVEELDI